MPTRAQYTQIAQETLAPYLSSPEVVWKGLYKLLMWYEHDVPHIIDADKLKRGAWRDRASKIEHYLAEAFECAPSELPHVLDGLTRSRLFEVPPQRQNPLGIGFVECLHILLGHFASDRYKFFPEGAIGGAVFPGVQDAPRSKPDIVVTDHETEIAVISAKWSLRHDRLKDVRDECTYFKTLKPGDPLLRRY